MYFWSYKSALKFNNTYSNFVFSCKPYFNDHNSKIMTILLTRFLEDEGKERHLLENLKQIYHKHF